MEKESIKMLIEMHHKAIRVLEAELGVSSIVQQTGKVLSLATTDTTYGSSSEMPQRGSIITIDLVTDGAIYTKRADGIGRWMYHPDDIELQPIEEPKNSYVS